VEYIYIIMITWRHFGKPEIVAVINNRICASLQIRQLLTGRIAQGDRRTRRTISPRHPPRASPMWSTITVVHDTGEAKGWRRETVTWYQPPRDTKTAGTVLGVGHQRQMTPHPPPPAGSDNNSQLSITLTFLRISLQNFKTDWARKFVCHYRSK